MAARAKARGFAERLSLPDTSLSDQKGSIGTKREQGKLQVQRSTFWFGVWRFWRQSRSLKKRTIPVCLLELEDAKARHLRQTLTVRLSRSEKLGQFRRTKGKNPFYIALHEKSLHDWPTRDGISNSILTESTLTALVKTVFMNPTPIRTLDLFVDKSERRFPGRYRSDLALRAFPRR